MSQKPRRNPLRHRSGELIAITVRPRSSRARVELTPEDGFVARVHAPASEGAANREAVELLAKALGVPKSAVRIVRGQKSRSKEIDVAGLSAAEARARLTGAAGREG